MDKITMIKALEDARKLHQLQMTKIQQLIAGKKIEHPTAVGKMDCECGLWFYGNKENLIAILGAQLFERLDKSHEAWHMEYRKIYNIFYKGEKKSFFSKLIGSKVDTLELDKAKLYYSELQAITKELLHTAETAIRRVSALSDAKFRALR